MPIIQPDTLDFVRELELNNNRDWFAANKKRYEESVRKPLESLAEAVIGRMKEIDPGLTMTPKDAVFRIYRDVRFSKDKSPYKTHLAVSVSKAGREQHDSPGMYWHLAARSMGIASGYYRPEPDRVKAIRAHIAANLPEFQKQLDAKPFKSLFETVRGEKNKILPPELKELAAQQPILFNKQFYYWAEYEAEEALRDDLPDLIMEHVRAAKPMNDFFARA